MEDDYCEYEEPEEFTEETDEDAEDMDTPPWDEEDIDEEKGGRNQMNFTASPFERMMKETPHPGWDNDNPWPGMPLL